MKKVLLFLSLFLMVSNCLFAQKIVSWEPEIAVANDSLYGSERPQVVVTGDGSPLVMWGKMTDNSIYVAKGNGSGFSSPVKINPNTGAFSDYWAGPEMAAAGDTVFVVFSAVPVNSNHIYLLRSLDGGVTFGDTVRVDAFVGDSLTRFPTIDVSPEGNPIVAFMEHETDWSEPRYVTTTSIDGGETFNPDVNASSDFVVGESCDCCPATVIAKENRRVMLFRNNDNNTRTMWAVVSNDNGDTYSSAVEVDTTNTILAGCPSSGPHGIIIGDTLYSAFRNTVSNNKKAIISSVHLTSLQMGSHTEVYTHGSSMPIYSQDLPKIAGDEEIVAAIWQEVTQGTGGGRNLDIIFSFTVNQNLSEISRRKDTLNLSLTGDQRTPDMAYRNGVFHVVYQDLESGDVMYRKGNVTDITATNNEVISQDELLVFPNPSKGKVDFVFLDNRSLFNVALYDITGKRIEGYSGIQEHLTINLDDQDFQRGLYFYMVWNESTSFNGKLVVQ